MSNHYEIQSEIDSRYGATIYPENTHKGGAGWFLYIVDGKKALSPAEMRGIAGHDVVNELVEECRELLVKTDHNEY